MTSPESQNNVQSSQQAESAGKIMNTEKTKKSAASLWSLMKEDLKHRRWMLIISSVVQGFAGPIVVLFMLSSLKKARDYGYYSYAYNGGNTELDLSAIRELVDGVTSDYMPIMQLIIAVVGALIVGIFGYRHLFNRRMTDMVNSLPVKREKQFSVIYLNGFLIWFVPFVISMIISMSMCAFETLGFGFGGLIAARCFTIIIGSLFCFLAVYTMIVLAVVLAGTVFNAILNIAFIGFDLILGFAVLYCLCDNYYDTFVRLPFSFETIFWVSPPISACFCGYIISRGEELLAELLHNGAYVFELIMTIAITVMNYFLALFIYSKRKSEEAESGVSNKPYRFLVRTLNAIYAGLLVSFIISEIVSTFYSSFAGWRIFFSAFFTVLTYGLIDVFQGRSFKAFFAHWKQMIAVTVVMELILVVFIYDLTGFDTRMISRSNIKGAVIHYSDSFRNSSSSDYYPVPGEDGCMFGPWYDSSFRSRYDIEIDADLAYDIISSRKLYFENGGQYLYDPVTGETVQSWRYSDQPWDERPFCQYVTIYADRKIGFDFCRGYRVADPDVIDEILLSDGYKENHFKIETGEVGYPMSISLQMSDGWDDGIEIPYQYIPMIMEAYYADFEENYSVEYLDAPMGDIKLNLRYRIYYSEEDYRNDRYSSNRFTICPVEEDSRTMEVLKQLVRMGVIDWSVWVSGGDQNLNDWIEYYEYYEDDYYPAY